MHKLWISPIITYLNSMAERILPTIKGINLADLDMYTSQRTQTVNRVSEVRSIYLDKNARPLLVSNEPALLGKASATISLLNDEQTDLFAMTLIKGLGRYSERWDEERYDASIKLLSLIPEGRLFSHDVFTTYLKAVREWPVDVDKEVHRYSLLQIGRIIMPHIPESEHMKDVVKEIWKQVGSQLSDDQNSQKLSVWGRG